MQRESVDLDRLTPAQIREGVEVLLSEIDRELTEKNRPPLTAAERGEIARDLSRSPLVALFARDLIVRGNRLSRESVFPRYLVVGESIQQRLTYAIHTRRVSGALPSDFIRLGSGGAYTESLAARLYEFIFRKGGTGADYGRFLEEHAPPAVWQRDDIQALQRAFVSLLAFQHLRDASEEVRRGAVLVSDRLHDPSAPGYVPGLVERLNHLGVYWTLIYSDIARIARAHSVIGEQLADEALAALEAEVVRREQERFGLGSRSAREGIDRNDRIAGKLSPACDFFTYEELEHFARWFVQSSSVPALCTLIRESSELLAPLGKVKIEEPCEQIDHSELVTVLVLAIRMASKRILCLLLTRTTPPPIVRWDDQKWYNLEVLANYIPPDTLASLSRETPAPGEWFDFTGDEIEGVPMYQSRQRGAGTPLEEAGLIRGYVIWDLFNKLLTHVRYTFTFYSAKRTLQPTDPPRVVASEYRHHGINHGWMAIVVLSGLLIVSPVSTNQTTALRDADLIVEETEEGILLPPQRLALMPGDVVVVKFDYRIFTDIDENTLYDMVVLRAAEEGTTWLEFTA